MTAQITKRGVIELAHHEGVVLEWYLDSKRVGTWGLGVTTASGHNVERYKDKPQTLAKVFEVAQWLLDTKYVPDVLEAFKGIELTDAQLTAATSFHWNTGAIKRASWVGLFRRRELAAAERSFLTWRNPPEIIERREAEAALFFDGKWASDGDHKVTVYPVRKPSYQPNIRAGYKVDVRSLL